MTTLDQLVPGQRATVHRVRVRGPLGQRLGEMGLVNGTPIRLIRCAPLGDPLEFEVSHYLLSLRRHEASQVEIFTP